MPLVDHRLPAGLAPYVASCVGYLETLDPATVHHGLPSPSATLILAFDDPLDSGWLAGGTTTCHWTMLGGLHVEPALIRTHGRLHGIQLGLTPLGVRALAAAPVSAVAEAITDGAELVPGLAGLHARLSEASGWEARFATLERFLLDAVRQADRLDQQPELAEAWRRLSATSGRVRVADLAGGLGWSRRRLSERFGAEFGLTPKQGARIFRFSRAQELARRHPLAEVAARAGFTDQAHLCREWRDLTGRTPTQSLAGDYHLA
jgi:AraC-like DNA-binding protein